MNQIPKVEVPSDILSKLGDYKTAGWKAPEDYVVFHLKLAYASLQKLSLSQHQVKASFLDDDGWNKGMSVLHAIVKKNGLYKLLRWSDSTQWWMWKTQCSGWALYAISEMEEEKEIAVEPHINWGIINPALEALQNGYPVRVEAFLLHHQDLEPLDYLVLGKFLELKGKYIQARSVDVIKEGLNAITVN